MTRDMSCSCEECLKDVRTSLHAWKEHTLCKRGNGNDDNNDQTGLVTEELEPLNQIETVNQIELDIQPNTRVCCVYEHNWYIGQVENVDKDDNEVEVNFLEKSGKYGKEYKWPTRPDKIWIPRTDILTVLQEPRSVGKTYLSDIPILFVNARNPGIWLNVKFNLIYCLNLVQCLQFFSN
jgi:hypothetical protein